GPAARTGCRRGGTNGGLTRSRGDAEGCRALPAPPRLRMIAVSFGPVETSTELPAWSMRAPDASCRPNPTTTDRDGEPHPRARPRPVRLRLAGDGAGLRAALA